MPKYWIGVQEGISQVCHGKGGLFLYLGECYV